MIRSAMILGNNSLLVTPIEPRRSNTSASAFCVLPRRQSMSNRTANFRSLIRLHNSHLFAGAVRTYIRIVALHNGGEFNTSHLNGIYRYAKKDTG